MARPNKGVEHVRKLSADPLATQRVELIHQTMYGQLSVAEACERLGISKSYFDLLRTQASLGAIAAVTPQASGRRAVVETVLLEEWQVQQDRIVELERENALLRAQVELAGVRAVGARQSKRPAASAKTRAAPRRRAIPPA